MPDEAEFFELLRGRLRKGAETYGDQSFREPLNRTLEEIEQELLDVCGWSYVAWKRIRALVAAAERLESRPDQDVIG